MNAVLIPLAIAGAVPLLHRLRERWYLSRAKHRSLRGHAKLALRVARLLPFYGYDESTFFCSDGADPAVVDRRRAGFARLSQRLRAKAPQTLAATPSLAEGISDVAFTNLYRVPFQFREIVAEHLPVGVVHEASRGVQLCDLDGNWSYDVGGAYGVNLLGHDFYKRCIERGVARVGALGPVLGTYHPVVADNVERLRAISGMDEVSFHMSGTEAVMQAVRLARYRTGRSHVVRFCGAYHGWWDGVQAGIGNPRPAHEVYTLKDMDEDTLRVLRRRKDIACVLVNAVQSMHPNGNAPSDGTLIGGRRGAVVDKAAYRQWLLQLREVCSQRGIALIVDDVFLGFRTALGGTQEYFGVKADLVTFGKTLGGGLPVGVVCGRSEWMRRYRPERPSDVCFARGTFNAHPYVMATMNEFLQHVMQPEVRATYAQVDATWDRRATELNDRLAALDVPVRVANLASIFTTLFTAPGRYHWLYQYYLRAEGLAMGWIGTGRFVFSHAYTDADFAAVVDRFERAAAAMEVDGWWTRTSELSERSIRRRVFREVLAASFRRSSPPRSSGRTAAL